MTKIEWTQKTWNPVTGCDKISQGCLHCYAADVAKRFWGDRPFSDVQFHHDRLNEPLKRKKTTMWFVNSMSDLFHDAVTDEQLDQIFAVMALTPHHTYQVLTKRPERMLEYLGDRHRHGKVLLASKGNQHIPGGMYPLAPYWPLPNVWLGVTVENQHAADERIPLLLQTPAAVRFLSCEPLLEEVALMQLHHVNDDGTAIDWVIVGGESGSKARPCDIAWIESIVCQCKDAGVPVFVKQLGSNPVVTIGDDLGDSTVVYPLSTGKGGNPDEWPESIRVREYPA